MLHLGDFPINFTSLCIPWDSFAAATGANATVTNFAAGDVQIYKDGGTTQRSSSAGIVASTSFDGQAGAQMITIDLSDNTDAGFYAAGHEYQVMVNAVTIDGQSILFWAATFSIQRAGGALALIIARLPNATPGAAGGVFIAGSNAATTVAITGNITGNLSGSVGSVTGAVGSVTGAVGSVTGNVGGNVTGSVGSVVGAVGSVTATVNADMKKINGTTVAGDGAGTPWGP